MFSLPPINLPVRDDFPLFSIDTSQIYLDSAASTQPHRAVIEAMSEYQTSQHANVHRGNHALADGATRAFEHARRQIAKLINAKSSKEVIWTSGTTSALNLLSHSLSAEWNKSDNIVLSQMEHHSNIVPWQLAAERHGFEIRVIPVTTNGELDLDTAEQLIDSSTRLVSICHVSNALGTVNPIERIIKLARQSKALIAIDGAQAIAHLPVDVQALDCDFYAFSGHKMYGPTGIGVLYGRYALLEKMPPWQGGGEMIERVSFSGTTFNTPPHRFEAGTPPICDAIGLGVAANWINNADRADWIAHEQALLAQLNEGLSQIPQVRLIANPKAQSGAVSFIVKECHHSDIATLLDEQGIAIRAGHHCTMPLMEALNLPGTLRASVGIYNNEQDIQAFLTALKIAIDKLTSQETNPSAHSSCHPKPHVPTESASNMWQPKLKDQIVDKQSLITLFENTKQWESRYRYLQMLGKQLPAMDKDDKTEANLVSGCESKVWLCVETYRDTQSQECIALTLDSDARIIKGLLAVVMLILDRQRVEIATDFDLAALLDQLGLSKHLSPSRTNGLKAVITQIKEKITQIKT